MLLDKTVIDAVGGKRSLFVREALVQAGDKLRVRSLIVLLLSVGVCELTGFDVKNLGLIPLQKKFSFCGTPMNYVLMPYKTFKTFPQIQNFIELQLAIVKNGLIGILDSDIS